MITRLDEDLHARVQGVAAERGLSANQFVVHLLTTAVTIGQVGVLDLMEITALNEMRRQAEAIARDLERAIGGAQELLAALERASGPAPFDRTRTT
ncbi:toxin-antitoxin system HicB family antitoxin [Amycolatopsis suaedae]|nr:toxin-antitoxin system HicB family antitoxin [Amycolatopsis suaedae]